jgi:hypothetical protein
MIWTHLTTLDEEIECIWNNNAGLTLNKALFVAVRYFTTVAFGFVPSSLSFHDPHSYHCRFHCLSKLQVYAHLKYSSYCSLALFLPRPSFEVSSRDASNVDANTHTMAGVSQCAIIPCLSPLKWSLLDVKGSSSLLVLQPSAWSGHATVSRLKTSIYRPFLLPPGLVILLLRTWAYAPSIHTPFVAPPSRGSSSIYDRTRKSLIYLGTLAAVTHLPTLVLGARG